MKKMILAIGLTGLYLSMTSSSCHSDHKKCDDDVVCTMISTAVSVEVKNSIQSPVYLDEVYTIRKKGNEVIHSNQDMATGNYVVLDDSYRSKLQLQTDSFFFVGKKNGVIVVNEPFVISADCCHIQKLSGKTTINL